MVFYEIHSTFHPPYTIFSTLYMRYQQLQKLIDGRTMYIYVPKKKTLSPFRFSFRTIVECRTSDDRITQRHLRSRESVRRCKVTLRCSLTQITASYWRIIHRKNILINWKMLSFHSPDHLSPSCFLLSHKYSW